MGTSPKINFLLVVRPRFISHPRRVSSSLCSFLLSFFFSYSALHSDVAFLHSGFFNPCATQFFGNGPLLHGCLERQHLLMEEASAPERANPVYDHFKEKKKKEDKDKERDRQCGWWIECVVMLFE